MSERRSKRAERRRRHISWMPSVVLASVGALVIGTVALNPGTAGPSGGPHSSMPGMGLDPMAVPAAAYTPYAPTLQREGWTAAASAAAKGHPAGFATDSNDKTYWSASAAKTAPASIIIDMRAPQTVSGLVYEPPTQGGSPVGGIGQFQVAVSKDGVKFTTVATGTWADKAEPQTVGITPVDTRFVRLTALTPASGPAGTVAAAELNLLGAPTPAAPPAAAAKAAARPAALSTDPSVVGRWGGTIGFPIVPVAAALLPGNKLLVWSADQALTYGNSTDAYTQTAILDLTTGTVSPNTVSNTGHNMFCPGVAILPDGEIMVTGGLDNQNTSIYNPVTNTWRAGPMMNVGRGYQSMTLLSNGQAFTLGGSWSGVIGGKIGEVWSPSGGWRELPGVPADPIYTQDAQGAYRADNHGWFIATSGGNLLQAGPSSQMNWIGTAGAGTITAAGTRGASADAMNGNAVYYDVNKVITMGGSPSYQNSTATNQAYQISIPAFGSTPTVTQSGSMAYPRAFANSVVLPNGQVLTMGGETYAVPFSDANSVYNAELWDPGTNAFSTMAAAAVPRNYHSVSVLLPDGTVFNGGGGLCGNCSTNHADGQIFTPPYLLNSDGTLKTRPTIASAPATATTGQTITVTTGGPVSQFSMVRYGEATHSVDNDQRRVPLQIVSASGNTYQLAVPGDPGIALPGPYMLFALDAAGVPSVASTITIGNVAATPPATHYSQTVVNDAPAMYWPMTEASGTTAADASGNGSSATYQGGGFAYGTPSPAEGGGGTGVTLNGSTSMVVATQPVTNPTPYSEEVWFTTTSTSGGLLTGFGTAGTGTASTSRDRVVYMGNNGQIYFGIYTNGPVVINSAGHYNDGLWHHLVATQGSDGMHLYVDGAQVAANATTPTAQNYLGYWRVGGDSLSGWSNSPTSGFLSGSVSDAAYYTTELSAAQVQTHFQAAGGTCPENWTCSDIGAPLPAGQQAVTGTTWSVSGGGGDIWAMADSFHSITRSLTGDGTVTTQVTAQTNSSVWAKAGVMLRATTDPGSPYYAAFVTPANGVVVQWRSVQGGGSTQVATTGTTPVFLKIARYTAGTTTYYTAYTSADGTTWTAVPGSTNVLSNLTAAGPLLAGVAITSHNQGTGSTATFVNPTVTAEEFPPPGLSCPTGWTCSDIGNALPMGQQTLTGGTWSILGGGGDIWSTADAFHYVTQPLAADGSVSAHVTAQANTSAWAKAGVMLRTSTDPGAPYYAVFVTPANGIAVQWRGTQGGGSTQKTTTGAVPAYLKVVRTGTSFTAYTSADGSTWTAVPNSTVTLANLAGPILRGLAVTSHNQGTGGSVTMDSVAMAG